MIPLRDTIPSRTVPFVTYGLLAINVLVFLHEVRLGPAMEEFVYTYGLVPRRFTFDTLVASMFVHGGWMHIIGNMLYLHIFGDNVEDRLGHARFLGMYLTVGIAAGMTQFAIDPSSSVPIVGASGAIAGVTGAYMLFFPRARVVTLIPLFIFFYVVEIPAVAFLAIWFIYQLTLGIGSLGAVSASGGVAFWAHIGGFVAGMIAGPMLATGRRRRRAGILRRVK